MMQTPTLADGSSHSQRTITVIDWDAALPKRPGTGPRIVRQPIAHETIAKPLWQPTAAENRPTTRSTGSGIVRAALIVTFGPLALAAVVIALALLALFARGFLSAFH